VTTETQNIKAELLQVIDLSKGYEDGFFAQALLDIVERLERLEQDTMDSDP
jgi:hypothetical protein